MKINDLELSEERKGFLKYVCNEVKAQSVTITDGNWEDNCKEITKFNQEKMDNLFKKERTFNY